MGNKSKMYVDLMTTSSVTTGSCTLAVVKFPNRETQRFCVDSGLFQEDRCSELNLSFPFEPNKLDFVLITHNHVDHTGRLPLLYKKGYNGKVYCSNQTKALLPIALEDTCKILKDVAKRQCKKRLYAEEDVDETLLNTVGIEFNKKVQITPNISATFLKNGHLIGASMILVEISYPGEEDINILFTGDYKDSNVFLDDCSLPEYVKDLRINVFIEATYGKMTSKEIVYDFDDKLIDFLREEKSIIIPVFSLGRAQEILLKLKELQDLEKIDSEIPIHFDGKLAHKYTRLLCNSDNLITKNNDFLPRNLCFVDSDMRERLLNTDNCKIIVTTSGMATYGPAQVYLPYFISKRNAAIMFTGYTAVGTLGRYLQEIDYGETVQINGLVLKKNASVVSSNEFSAHAKSDELLKLLGEFSNLRSVIVNHGEEESKNAFAERVVENIEVSKVGVINRDYFFRIGAWGIIKTLSTKFR